MTQPQPDTEAVKAFNAKITAEFRANSGKVGAFEGTELLLLTTTISGFAELQAKTSRVIPIFELQPVH